MEQILDGNRSTLPQNTTLEKGVLSFNNNNNNNRELHSDPSEGPTVQHNGGVINGGTEEYYINGNKYTTQEEAIKE